MKSICSKLLLMGLLTVFMYSCNEDDSVNEVIEEVEPVAIIKTFGIRHDKTLAEYEAIVNATGDYPNFESVVFISVQIEGAGFTASGVLIDEDWVLTAAHSFWASEEQTNPATAENIKIKTGNDPNELFEQYDVETVVFHPTWLTNDDIFNGNDICLLKLRTPITNITPVAIFSDNSVQIGSEVWASGFGGYGEQPGQNPDLESKKHAYHNVLDRKTDDRPTTINGTTYRGGHLAFDFDNPSATVNSLGDNYFGDDEETLFVAGGTSSSTLLDLEGTTVAGDSGGPIFIKDGDEWKVAGVLSGGLLDSVQNGTDSGYGDISLFTRTYPVISWMQSVIE